MFTKFYSSIKKIPLLTIILFSIFTACDKDEKNNNLLEDIPGTVKDIDGNIYSTVIIGEQEWMVENLRTTTYTDGTKIPLEENQYNWSNLSSPSYCWYDNDSISYSQTYGALYNWYTVETTKLCPDGWHIPTDEDWKILEEELGMNPSELNQDGFRGTDVGSKIAGNADLWIDEYNKINNNAEFGSTDFNGYPGGLRDKNGDFTFLTGGGYWWTSTEYSEEKAWIRHLGYNDTGIYRFPYGNKQYGLSIRCLKD